jgi:hypothetical protein
MSPAQEKDCVSRLPIHAIMNSGTVPPTVNKSVNAAAPARPMRKLTRPPHRSPKPPKKSLPSA